MRDMRDKKMKTTEKKARREASKPLQAASRRARRPSRCKLMVEAVDGWASEEEQMNEESIVLEVTDYACEDEAACKCPCDGIAECEEHKEDEEVKWPTLERMSSSSDDECWSLAEWLSRGAERPSSRGERLSSSTEIDDVPFFSLDSSIDGEIPEGFALPSPVQDDRMLLTWGWQTPAARGPKLTLDAVLNRRHVTAALLTGRGAHNALLPCLPEEVALSILHEALPLLAALACFSTCTRVELLDARKARSLQLQGCGLGLDGAEVLGWLLRHSAHLETLDVSHNPLGAAGAACLGRALPRARHLRALTANEAALSGGGTDASGLDALAAGVAGHPALRLLALGGNAIGANGGLGVRGLVSALAHPLGGLEELLLGDNALGPAGAAAVAGLLVERGTLRRLDLSANQLTGAWGKCLDGVRALAMALACNASLEELNLATNHIGAHLSESVNLWWQRPTNALLLARALTYNSGLATLDMRGNHIVGSQEEQLRASWAGSGGERAGAALRL